jgi:hypothetical protein
MRTRKLRSLEVSAVGPRLRMTPIYGAPDPAPAITTIRCAAPPG